MVMKSVAFIVGFIKQVENAQSWTLAAMFIKKPDVVDQVLEKLELEDRI